MSQPETCFALDTLPRVGHTLPMKISELITDLLEWYRTVADKERMADEAEARWRNHLAASFADVESDEFSTKHQRMYRARRKQEGDSNSTVDNELQVIRRAYKLAYQQEPPLVSRVPAFELVRTDNARRVFIDGETADKLKKAAHRLGLWQGCLIEMAFTYGWRRSELLGLKVRDINLSDGTVRLLKTKNGESREVPLTTGIKQMLRKLVEGQSQDAPLFPARTDFYEWGLICKEAGVPCGENGGYIFHDIRRSSARNKRAAGVDTSLIMAMQGWKTEAMFRRYAIVDTTDLSRALAQEAKFMKGALC